MKTQCEITLGSLFDGSGGFPLGGVINGIRPVWASEIEPYPMRVTAARFPCMKQLGDVTKINGAEIEPVDIITFGSPCQDLSVAGKQAGIHDGKRSSLFFEAVRIIKEMRDVSANKYPRFAVWENVPGAFSSNKGEDFRTVIEALGGVCENGLSIPRPTKWNPAGCVVGNGWSIAWRVYDAQYWGVPQRRKRIYLIADFGSERAGEILFEREGVRGDTATGRETREGTTGDAERGAGGGGGVRCMNPWDSQSIRQYDTSGVWPNLNANSGGGLNRSGVVYKPAAFMGGQGAKARSIAYCDDGSTPTLKSAPSGGNTIPDVVYALQGNGIDRADTAGCNGAGWREGEMYTLNTIDRPAVVYPDKARCLAARYDSSPCIDRGQNVICFKRQNVCADSDTGFTLQAGRADGQHIPSVVYDARGNGDGKTAPTLTGDHQNRVTDYTAVCVTNRGYVQGNISETLRSECHQAIPIVCMKGERNE